MNKKIKIALFSCLAVVALTMLFIIWFYLFGLNIFLKSDFAAKTIKDYIKKHYELDLDYKEPELKTHLRPLLDFKVKDLTLKKDNQLLVQLKDFDSLTDYRVSKKIVKLERLKASVLIVDLDKLMKSFPETKKEDGKKSDWKLNFYNADLKLDDFELAYRQKNNTLLNLYMRDIFFDLSNKDKTLSFNLDSS